jgi:Cof subfamily protein (haloacid dehalogenase superfamily)
MKNNIKMIVTDLDRTLLRADKTVSDYTARVLKVCRECGILLVFATARFFRTIDEWLVPVIGVQPDITISSNGAYAYGPCEHIPCEHGANKVWYQALINAELANRMIHEIRRRSGEITVGTSRLRLSERTIEKTHAAFSAFCDFKTALSDDVHYIDYRGGTNVGEDILRLFPQVRLQSYVDLLTTFVHKNARKGFALQEIMKQLLVTPEEVVGFGDDVNDLDFLPVCGTKIAVANALDEVKAVADYVCQSNDEDGVAKWIDKNVL